MATDKARKPRQTSMEHDVTSPAYRVVHGVFGGPAAFSRLTRIPVTTAHEWLYRGFVPGKRMAHIRAVAEREGVALDPVLFVPDAKLDDKLAV